ncbi:hypothetical protein GCM10008955_32590 [Deinococcus malanensis]|uniref:Uncharacterized protein n=1 Tax=Deinococcus malanensis TaxID=1706855 RepID=A0ABQ2F3H5_9DEIO|nr:hypothetical protein GCM10008955_32590 [Deinococcus malanensis]
MREERDIMQTAYVQQARRMTLPGLQVKRRLFRRRSSTSRFMCSPLSVICLRYNRPRSSNCTLYFRSSTPAKTGDRTDQAIMDARAYALEANRVP